MKKKNYVIIGIVGLIIIIAVIANPNQDRQKEILKTKLYSLMQESIKGSTQENNSKLNQAGQVLGMMFVKPIIDNLIDNFVSSDNYVFFSTTKINWEGNTKVIGIAAFGNIFLSSELERVLNEGLLKDKRSQAINKRPIEGQEIVEDAITISKGVELLFKGVKTTISKTDKIHIYKELGFYLSKNKKHFEIDADPGNYYDYTSFDATVNVTDMNKDGVEEIFVTYGNDYTSGVSGSSIVLFIKDGNNEYKKNLGFPGAIGGVLSTSNQGYNDLSIDAAGLENPIWSWNGKEYVINKNIKSENNDTIKATSLENFIKRRKI